MCPGEKWKYAGTIWIEKSSCYGQTFTKIKAGQAVEKTGVGAGVTMKDMSLYIGIIAGICTAVSLLPQLIKIIHEKKANDISYWMLFILLLGLAGWITYGILKMDWPIIITNGFSVLINILIIIFSIRYKEKKQVRD